MKAMDGKIDQVHGRIKSIETVVLGDEEKGIIGLAEKHRNLESENKALDKKRAAAFVIVGWVAAFFGQYALNQWLPQKAIAVAIEASRQTTESDHQVVRSNNRMMAVGQ
jgi:hypothetical protein